MANLVRDGQPDVVHYGNFSRNTLRMTKRLLCPLDGAIPSLTVVADPSALRLLDGDDHGRHDRHARRRLARSSFSMSAALPLPRASSSRHQPPRALAQIQECRAHLLQALDAERRHRFGEGRNGWRLDGLHQHVQVVLRRPVEDVPSVRLPRRILEPRVFTELILRQIASLNANGILDWVPIP